MLHPDSAVSRLLPGNCALFLQSCYLSADERRKQAAVIGCLLLSFQELVLNAFSLV